MRKAPAFLVLCRIWASEKPLGHLPPGLDNWLGDDEQDKKATEWDYFHIGGIGCIIGEGDL
jgi:hypothetical protein